MPPSPQMQYPWLPKRNYSDPDSMLALDPRLMPRTPGYDAAKVTPPEDVVSASINLDLPGRPTDTGGSGGGSGGGGGTGGGGVTPATAPGRMPPVGQEHVPIAVPSTSQGPVPRHGPIDPGEPPVPGGINGTTSTVSYPGYPGAGGPIGGGVGGAGPTLPSPPPTGGGSATSTVTYPGVGGPVPTGGPVIGDPPVPTTPVIPIPTLPTGIGAGPPPPPPPPGGGETGGGGGDGVTRGGGGGGDDWDDQDPDYPLPLAEGGIVSRPTRVRIAERGPEAVLRVGHPLAMNYLRRGYGIS